MRHGLSKLSTTHEPDVFTLYKVIYLVNLRKCNRKPRAPCIYVQFVFNPNLPSRPAPSVHQLTPYRVYCAPVVWSL